MKPHLPLILLGSLLAVMHSHGEDGYYAYVETDAATNAFIPNKVPCIDYTGAYTNERLYETSVSMRIKGETLFDDCAYYDVISAFNADGSRVTMQNNNLIQSRLGSIILKDISIKEAALLTPCVGAVDEKWGLAQIVLCNAKFLKSDMEQSDPEWSPVEFTTNYCTVREWEATDCKIKIMAGNATFTSGTVNGEVSIAAEKNLKIDGLDIRGALSVNAAGTISFATGKLPSNLGWGTLTLTSADKVILGREPDIGEQVMPTIQGNVVVDYTGGGAGPLAWDVDVKSKVEGSLTVTAANGRLNAGILSGAGNLAAKQIYLTSFSGSSLSLQAGESVMLKGGVIAADTVSVAGGQLADITFQGDIQAGGRVTLAGKTIVGEDDESTLSAASLVASAAGDFSIAGGLKISGGQQSTITSTEGRVIFQGATDKTNLANTAIHASTVTMNGMTADNVQITGATGDSAAAVSYSDKLVLKNQSSIKGNVTGSTDSCIILMESRVDGVVSNAAELTLDTGIIEGAESIFKLASKGTSQISNQNEVTVDTLSLGGGTLTLGTPESHGNDLVMQNLTVAASTILNANMVLKDGAMLEFAENAVVTLGCNVTLLGDATFTTGVAVPETPAVAGVVILDSVEDVLDADGKSITLSWDQSAGMPRWHKELYKVGDKTYTTDASAAGATLTNLSLVYERTYSDNGPFNGTIRIAALPEPATGTLSLLALASLAARRRKRHANLISNK